MNRKVILFIAAFILLYFSMGSLSEFFVDYEWFKLNRGPELYWVLFFAKFNVGLAFTVAFVALFFLNFLLIRILGGKGRIFTNNILDRLRVPVFGSPRRALFVMLGIGVITTGAIMGSAASAFWKEYLMFSSAVPFDGYPADPIFGRDLGFYVFTLPFYRFLYGWIMGSLVVITLFSIFFHLINGGILFRRGIEFSLFARTHISSLLGLLVLIHGLGYRLSAYKLLFNESGRFFGAGYTAVHANLLAYNVAMVISFIAAGLLFANIIIKSFKMPIIVLIVLIPAYFVIGTILPSLQQRFIVVPNELEKERPYITQNIKYTRLAYDLERVKETEFANRRDLTYRDIKKNANTMENIRLWDWRPLKQTYKQLQELKPYYYFNDIDVDRYIINGKKTSVNISARELSIEQLGRASATWQNYHLIYTHGYGVALSRVDRVTPEGQPEMLIYDIPPKFAIDLPIERPEIYFGEHKNSYAITNTTIDPGEFDYPSGEENKYTTYRGTGGVVLDSFLKRLMFALHYKDINILISGNIKNSSRILYRRNILDMVNTMTPFLEIDNDPYLVISDKKLYWVIDAFTTSDQFPYSAPALMYGKKVNYVRNSVKIVIDAYNGAMNYYVMDDRDPILKAYSGLFPAFFRKLDEMTPDLKSHLRYSEDMFNLQCQILLRYHMTDPNVFYNNEDAWNIPGQEYEGSQGQLRSYYLVTQLPGEKQSEFILIMPFTPLNKNNMIAFLTAKCDIPTYGEMNLHLLPKDKLSYGPMQIEARINQDPEISKQLTLWGQRGSGVIRGNMLVIPIEQSLLFIQPLYLKAQSSEMPELKQVIVSFNDKIVMERDLETAIEKLFYSGTSIQIEDLDSRRSYSDRMKDLAGKAYTHYSRAEQQMKSGNWKEYGSELDKLKEVLTLMKNMRE